MRIEEAKSINIDDLLERLGYQPIKCTSKGNWYKRPYGEEKHASFHTSRDGRAWFDFGEGIGGNIIDLAIRMGDCRDVRQALAWIEDATNTVHNQTDTTHQRPVLSPEPPTYTLTTDRPLADRRGENWCRSRGLKVEGCRPYLRDVYFNRSEKPLTKPLYGVGLANVAGGFEVRTQFQGGPWIKGSVGAKAISVFETEQLGKPWFVFEGLPDFLTFITVRRPAVGEVNLMVLNGTGMTTQAMDYLKGRPAGCLYLCPQYGSQGSLKSCETLQNFVAGLGWDGGSLNYPKGYEDYNAWHMAVNGVKPFEVRRDGLKTTPRLDP